MTLNGDIVDVTGLQQADLGASPAQIQAVAGSCLAINLESLKNFERSELQNAIKGMQGDISKAVDLLRARRGRIKTQRTVLQAELDAAGVSDSNVQTFFSLASKAIFNCQDLTTAAQRAKEGVDLVYAKTLELRYRLAMLEALESSYNTQEQELAAALASLDQVTLTLEVL